MQTVMDAIARGEFSAMPPLGDSRRSLGCMHCHHGFEATKLKRQWVHHDSRTGRIVVCVARDLKPQS